MELLPNRSRQAGRQAGRQAALILLEFFVLGAGDGRLPRLLHDFHSRKRQGQLMMFHQEASIFQSERSIIDYREYSFSSFKLGMGGPRVPVTLSSSHSDSHASDSEIR